MAMGDLLSFLSTLSSPIWGLQLLRGAVPGHPAPQFPRGAVPGHTAQGFPSCHLPPARPRGGVFHYFL